ncbi:MAG: GGDEF domain-containing protein [Candidatus Sedimenticola sp. (ex Thyasira tokunagai)]
MDSSDEQKPQCPLDESECRHIDELMALRLRTNELEELVHTDTLTGLFNYRYFLLALEQELERTRRSGHPTSLVMLDLDHFKGVNDTWGHEVGNQVLRQTADIIGQLLRRVDLPCRYGGEEFVLILPATPLPRAITVAERLRRAIADTPIELGSERFSVTVSMGVSVYGRNSKMTSDDFIQEADALLYQAKEGGRNRVEHTALDEARPAGQVSKDEKSALFDDFD